MVTSNDDIARRLADTDAARSARRQQAALTVGELVRRHTELSGQLADLDRQLGEVLATASDVFDLPELAEITDIPRDALTRWRDQATTPGRGGKRARSSTTKKSSTPGTNTPTATTPRATRTAAAGPPIPEPVGTDGATSRP